MNGYWPGKSITRREQDQNFLADMRDHTGEYLKSWTIQNGFLLIHTVANAGDAGYRSALNCRLVEEIHIDSTTCTLLMFDKILVQFPLEGPDGEMHDPDVLMRDIIYTKRSE